VWRELLQWLKVDAIPLPLNDIKANAGEGELSSIEPHLCDQLRLRLAAFYEVLK
jgi:hypothetical protein